MSWDTWECRRGRRRPEEQADTPAGGPCELWGSLKQKRVPAYTVHENIVPTPTASTPGPPATRSLSGASGPEFATGRRPEGQQGTRRRHAGLPGSRTVVPHLQLQTKHFSVGQEKKRAPPDRVEAPARRVAPAGERGQGTVRSQTGCEHRRPDAETHRAPRQRQRDRIHGRSTGRVRADEYLRKKVQFA